VTISSEVQVYNLALNAVGERSNISSPTEQSRPAEVCHLWYSTVRDQILSAAPWPEATKIAYPALLAEADDEDAWLATEPRTGYNFVYAMPSDALRPRYMSDFSRFLYTSYGDQRALHSNTESAILAYTSRLENVSLWDAELQMAIVYGLAANICMPLSGKPARAKMLADKANELVISARVNAANSNNETFESVPDWIIARGFNISSPSRYFHPYGGLLTVSYTN
jgi:hypothetical protein